MSVRVHFGGSAASVREKAVQDLEQIRARLAKSEQEVVSLRQQEREKSHFIKTLDGYIESHIHILNTADTALTSNAIKCENISTFYFKPKPGLQNASVAAAMQAVVTGLQPTCTSVASAAVAAAAAQTTHDMRSLSAKAIDDYNRMFGEPTASTVKKVARVGTNMRAVTDAAYDYLDLMDHYASTEKLAEFIRSKPEIYSLLGTRQTSTLSSYLSRDPRFDFQKSRGWTLDQSYVEDFADQGGVIVSGFHKEGGV
ncbi:hypothetical protein [Brevundimonas nasdae]|uniref:Uncharacterized protein n=1 Tax=Brevundimonas nasdae TaxID=172043 RepID=A0ACD4VKB3_9CAUL|nr:hypothetical protein [Brevundimonas nasdae]WOB78471.1 hypothetical protein PZA08_14385 [Brevundimonas nasdae]